LKAGDAAGYRRVCTRLVEGVGAEPPVAVANVVAWVCAVGPDGLGNYTRVLALAEEALGRAQTDEKAHVLNTLGGVLYRAGRYREAVSRLREGIRAGGGEGTVHDWALLALAHERLGESGEARKYLAKVAQHKPPDEGAPWGPLEVELLGREVEALVGR
jgi:tetratricopeptide (TPR) repeat protein